MSANVPANRITDAAQFGRVAVLMGGTSSEREVSLDSGSNVLEALRRKGVDAFKVDGIPALIESIQADKVDRVFNILHGNRGGGEDGVLQGLLQAFGIPFTGSDVLGSALSMDKIRTKQVWLAEGLPTPRYVRIASSDDVHAAAQDLGLPVIIKPSCEGSSVGVSRVMEDKDIDGAVELAARYQGEMLMEQMIVGDELTVPVVQLGETLRALPSIHIVPKGEWYDYEAKYVSDETQYLCPGLNAEGEAEIGALAVKAFKAAGCKAWGRVDFMRDRETGKFYLLEVNTAPGMTSHSLVPKSAGVIGIDFPELCWRILETTMEDATA